MPWTSLCELTDLCEGSGKYVEVAGFQLAVFLHGGQVYVMDNRCPHAGANLSAGWILDGCAVCPKHGWPFRLDNGELRDIPNGAKVDVYSARLLEREGQPTLVQAQLPLP
jgi:nitrite reductase (NADH) small subunit/3-phenylpropionate/trans-cinnamate dioxygenase ferredoxin subunit